MREVEVPAERRGEVRRVGMRFKRASVADFDAANGTELVSVVSLAHAIRDNDETAISGFRGRHFRFAKTNDTLKGVGLSGDYFTIRAGVILRHNDKDAAHDITPDEWADIADALTNKKPQAVEKRGEDSFRIWTQATIGGRIAVVGADVKNAGRDIDVNSIATVFGAEGISIKEGNLVYPETQEEKRSVLTRLNSGRYTASLQDGNSISQSAAGSQGGAEISPAEDAAYMDAVGRGDMETAQRMVREAFESSEGFRDADGVYHYKNAVRAVGYRIGDVPERGRSYNTRDGSYEEGVSLIGVGNLPQTKSFAISALKDKGAKIVYVEGDVLTKTGGDDEFVMRNPRVISKDRYDRLVSSDRQKIAEKILADSKWDRLARIGADRADVLKWADASKKLSLDPVTYDDAGNVIPLSQRFNPKNPGIRFKLDKDAYQGRREWAARRMRENKRIGMEHGMSEDQVDALEKLAAGRHEMHSNIDSLVHSVDSGYADRLFKAIDNLPSVGLPALKDGDRSIQPEFIDTLDTLEDTDPDYPENGLDDTDYFNDNYSRIYDTWERINKIVEDYLGKIDEKYGTAYKPTGATRFKRNAAFEHSLDALQSIADGADYGVLHNAKYGEIRYPKGRMGDGGMGFMHIVEHRMNGGATLEEAVDTAIRVGQSAEIGKETKEEYNTRHLEFDGARAIIAIMPEQTPIITGYEIDADETATANRRAAELAPHPHVRSDEVIGVLRNRIANLRAEVKGGMRFKVGGIFTGTAADYANRSRQGGVEDGPSLVKIGTGEGNQVFGWGLYGSTVRGVAEGYAKTAARDKRINQDENTFRAVKKVLGDRMSDDALQAVYEAITGYNDWKEVKDWLKRNAEYDEEAGPLALAAFRQNESALKKVHDEFAAKEHLYEQTFFTDRAPGDESHLLMWEEQIGLQKLKDITAALPFEKQKIFRSWLRDSLPYGNKPQHAWGKDVYEALSNTLEGPKSASEFLRDKLGYDGVKYPVGSYGSVRKLNGDEAGWNYVSFRDDNIRVDHKWTDGQMRYKLSAPVDDPDVLFGARESRKAHGLDDLTAEESGLAYTDKELYAAGQRIAKDVPHMMNVVNDALTSDRALPLEDTFALTVVHNLHSRTRNFTAESKSRLMNCEYCEYWICGEK